MIVDTGHANKIWVGMCGEMAGDPMLTPILLGLGLDEISVSPVMLPEIKRIIRSMSFKESKAMSDFALSLSSGIEVLNYLKEKREEIDKRAKAKK
jgi:phosphotransferase system enzyme I (PtsI)